MTTGIRAYSTPVDQVGEYLHLGARVKHVPTEPGVTARSVLGYVRRFNLVQAYVWWDGDSREVAAYPSSLVVVGSD